ncbi:MAG: mannose-1-phosphate guanylyltransferase [Candidatus Omnitrophica bacterium]|nr:mannose-1-phosphate guanylyltransferase [Candidatus Omnitrophota bacterium]
MGGNLWTLIMAGGSGERLWPLSRRTRPKQTLRLGSKHSLLQVTADRMRHLIPATRTVVVTTQHQAGVVRLQLPFVSEKHFLVEPAARNTAAAIGLGTIAILQEDPEAVIVVVSADHVIRPADRFIRAVRKAANLAVRKEGLVCFGIKPTYPATGYGYIEKMGSSSLGGYRVRRFLEKPDLATARKLIKSPRILWNSGIFCWKGTVIMAAIRQWLPRLYAGLHSIQKSWGTSEGDRRLGDLYRQLPSVSIDIGVMERSRHVWVVPADFTWDDVGSWNSLAFLHQADSQGNIILGTHVGVETQGSIVVSGENHVVATIGIRDLVVVQTPDATLICHKSQAQAVRKIVAMLKSSPRLKKHL